MHKSIITMLVGGLLCSSICTSIGRADPEKSDSELTTNLKATMAGLLENMNREDMEQALAAYHPDSPIRARSELTLKTLFAGADCKHELVSLAVVGADSDYAYVRTSQKSTILKRAEGEKSLFMQIVLKEGVSDAVFGVKQKGKDWRIWHTLLLGHTEK